MLKSWELFSVSAAYVLLLFAIASRGDRRAATHGAPRRKPWTYALALGVYCTSWTFYGAVGSASLGGWDYLPIYLGPILVFTLGGPLVARVVRLSKRHNITSIADFLGARYGRRQPLAVLVTLIATVGVVPYIALQLKAVAFGFETLTGSLSYLDAAPRGVPQDATLIVALWLAGFAILFGTRQIVSSENHHGMVLAVAFESAVKLAAFVAVGLYVCYALDDGPSAALRAVAQAPVFQARSVTPGWTTGFVTQTLLAACAMFCLPRQFHIAVVENAALTDLRRARWFFPLYLAVICALVPPITIAGLARLPTTVSADTYLLALPLAGGDRWLALVAYLGGFSAATSMIIVATVALSTMISNEVVVPLLLRSPRLRLDPRADLSGLIKAVRRLAIVALVAAGYLYFRLVTGPGTLAELGLLSMVAVAQFAPAMFGGLCWRGASYRGAIAGLAIGFALWAYTLLLPSVLRAAGAGQQWLLDGPLGLAWLRPQALLGLSGLDWITHGALCSLGANLALFVLIPLWSAPRLRERLHAERFLIPAHPATDPGPAPRSSATVGDLTALLERLLGTEPARAVLVEYARSAGTAPPAAEDRAAPALLRQVERMLAGTLGASTGRRLLLSVLSGRDMQVEEVIRLLDATSHEIQFNRELLRSTLEHLSQGVSVVDRELRLVAWNRRYVGMFGYPAELVTVGQPIEALLRYNAGQGLLAGHDEAAIARRLAHLRAGHAYTHERELPDGTVIEVRGNPMPGGGFVTSYSDVTAYKRAQRALQEINETLEQRVAERTRALAAASQAAERANQAKTRFLAAASHDLAQPLNAARLFTAALGAAPLPPEAARLTEQIGESLAAAETLLGALLDISRLDAAAVEVKPEHVRLAQVLEPLAGEFAALARDRHLDFRLVPTKAVVHTDPHLLRRVLQNFLSNALRYTRSGRVLIGCRRLPGALRIEVWDTGPGIAPERQREIFEEFRRLENDAGAEHGLGLGLAIADRLARLLGHPLGLRSWPGRGSVFSITVPLGLPAAIASRAAAPTYGADDLAGVAVLCIDDEPATLNALDALLRGWGCRVIVAGDLARAERLVETTTSAPDLALVDFHLGAGQPDGIEVLHRLRRLWRSPLPAIVLTADHTPRARAAAAALGCPLLPKPVKPASLRALMVRVLASREPTMEEV